MRIWVIDELKFRKHRRLQHAALDPRLDQLAKISTIKRANKWYGDLADHGATKHFQKLVPRDAGLKPYWDRVCTFKEWASPDANLSYSKPFDIYQLSRLSYLLFS